MKVKIGPYINFWSTSYSEQTYLEWRHGKCYWNISSKEYTRLDKIVIGFLDFWQEVLNLTVNKIQDRRTRTVNIQIDDYDTWGMDSTLSQIILPMLIQLKKKQHGAGFVDNEDVPFPLSSESAPPVKDVGDTDDNHFKRWDYVIDEMIWAFTQIKDDDWESQFHTGEFDMISIPIDYDGNEVPKEEADLFEMARGPNDTSKFDAEGHKAFNDRITNGTRLLGKYYRNLWD